MRMQQRLVEGDQGKVADESWTSNLADAEIDSWLSPILEDDSEFVYSSVQDACEALERTEQECLEDALRIIRQQEEEDQGKFVHGFANDFQKATDQSAETEEVFDQFWIHKEAAEEELEEMEEAHFIIQKFLEECDVPFEDSSHQDSETMQETISYYQGADHWMTFDEQNSLVVKSHHGDVSENKDKIGSWYNSDLHGGAEEEEEKTEEIRGGAGGSHSTAKKREWKELVSNFQQWIDSAQVRIWTAMMIFFRLCRRCWTL